MLRDNIIFCLRLEISYDLERTLCEVFLRRSNIDCLSLIEAIVNCVLSVEMFFYRFYLYARIFGVIKILYNYLDILL